MVAGDAADTCHFYPIVSTGWNSIRTPRALRDLQQRRADPSTAVARGVDGRYRGRVAIDSVRLQCISRSLPAGPGHGGRVSTDVCVAAISSVQARAGDGAGFTDYRGA